MAAVLGAAGYRVETPSDLVGWVREHDGCVVVITLATEPAWVLLAAVAGAGGDVLIVALLPIQDGRTGLRAVRAGAHAVLGRDASPARLQQTVEAALRGLSQLPVDVVRALHEAFLEPVTPPVPSPQQLSWLRALAAGITVARLAELESYSERAMYRMLQRLYSQLGVGSRTEALMRAQALGWLAADGDQHPRPV